MDVDGAVVEDGFVYVLCGGEWEEHGYEKVAYVGGSRKCIVVKEGDGVGGGVKNRDGDYKQ